MVHVMHTEHKILNRDKIRVKMRQADRFDFHSSTGEDANEISLKLSGLSEQLTVSQLSLGSFSNYNQYSECFCKWHIKLRMLQLTLNILLIICTQTSNC